MGTTLFAVNNLCIPYNNFDFPGETVTGSQSKIYCGIGSRSRSIDIIQLL